MPKPTVKSFQATLERDNTPLKWTIIRIPFDAAKLWGTRGQLRVKGEINGFAFRTSLFPNGKGGHTMIVNKTMQKGSGMVVGSTAKFKLEPDAEKRVPTVPAELKSYLAEDRMLKRWYESLNPSARNDISTWVTQVKSAEARERRAEQIAERMLATMEAEHELPPAIKVAFAENLRARAGWERMSPTHRRRHLFGIFYYRTPEGRARRIEKMLQEAEGYAEKKISKG